MHSVRIQKVIDQMIYFYYRVGIWCRGDVLTAKQSAIKTFYWIYYSLFSLSLLVGTITCENMDERIFLAETSIMAVVFAIKFWILIWKQNEILDLLNRICVFSIRYDEDFSFFNQKLGKFMKFVVVFLWAAFVVCSFTIIVSPFVGNERKFIANIAFPLDYKNNEIAFWIAYIFQVTEVFLSIMIVSISTVIWYLMYHCSLTYEVLGREITKMGYIAENKKVSEVEKHQIFFEDLTGLIDAHLYLKGLIDELASFTSDLFFIQFGTSAMCICGSVYSLAFYIDDNYVVNFFHIYTIFYNTAELFMITYFGNEIMLSSDSLSYSLFESNWVEQPQSTKKCIIIFGEYLKQPHVLLIGKLYPLALDTFRRILNSAYNLFNILINLKK